MKQSMSLKTYLEQMPLIAVLRGITPDEALPVTTELFEAGFRIVEVTLNSPAPLTSIKLIAETFGENMLVGAGTVLSPEDVDNVSEIGGNLIVSPNFDPEVVSSTKAKGLYSIPGVQTMSEAFAALKSGADALKIFPAAACPPQIIKAMRAVLPKDVIVIPVGGINETNMSAYWEINSNGFGIGSNLYKPGKSIKEIRSAAEKIVTTMSELKKDLENTI